jgi:hypothetical protein
MTSTGISAFYHLFKDITNCDHLWHMKYLRPYQNTKSLSVLRIGPHSTQNSYTKFKANSPPFFTVAPLYQKRDAITDVKMHLNSKFEPSHFPSSKGHLGSSSSPERTVTGCAGRVLT